MTKADLIAVIAEKLKFPWARAEVLVDQVIEAMVEALKACGGNVQFTLYPHVGHDSWTQTYANPLLYAWFLEHARTNDTTKER